MPHKPARPAASSKPSSRKSVPLNQVSGRPQTPKRKAALDDDEIEDEEADLDDFDDEFEDEDEFLDDEELDDSDDEDELFDDEFDDDEE